MSLPLIVSSPILGDSKNVGGFTRFGEFANLRGFAKLGKFIKCAYCMNGHLATKKSSTLFFQILTISKPHHGFHFSQIPHLQSTIHYKFDTKMKNVTRLYQTKSIITINNLFPSHGLKKNLFLHAHISWLITTLYGPIVILPKRHVPYPFPHLFKKFPLFLVMVESRHRDSYHQALQTGGAPNISDAYTINCLPSPSYNCSVKSQIHGVVCLYHIQRYLWNSKSKVYNIFEAVDTFKLNVNLGKTYLLLLVNNALNDEFFFSVANHTLVMVEVDALYVKPLKHKLYSSVLKKPLIQVQGSQYHNCNVTRPCSSGPTPFDNTTITRILDPKPSNKNKKLPLLKALIPKFNDSSFAMKFHKKILNNMSFVQPSIALLQAHFFNKAKGVFATDFSANPLIKFNYTGTPPRNTMVNNGTKAGVLPFNTSVELVMQDTSIIEAESHPLHLHGFNLFVLGQEIGNFNPSKDPAKFNLVDLAKRNTVGVPSGGWVVIRFLTDCNTPNPCPSPE
ncbi:hypothetical protein CXB51_002949 [Gossypium anomalum]|uniref:Laccase n=1 Tax=Gossypium anomalum TaxID=47600 RepID=A0A8J6D9Q6_9ROSI|nr:hypothetical protein CXB51_002949 [Gossypium anomalum]